MDEEWRGVIFDEWTEHFWLYSCFCNWKLGPNTIHDNYSTYEQKPASGGQYADLHQWHFIDEKVDV